MTWSAIVPLNIGRERKTRLSARLDATERMALAEAMASHVLAQLRLVSSIGAIAVLSPQAPNFGGAAWRQDRGRGLNAELAELVAEQSGNTLILHGDLPLLAAADIEAMLHAGEAAGIAIAPDRHGEGTNALALRADRRIDFCFGAGSFAAHRASAGPDAAAVARAGLGLDVDEPADLELALAGGWCCGG